MNSLIQNLANVTETENGALSNASTLSAALDFFGQGGAVRTLTEAQIISLFKKAFYENRAVALKTLFYFRDVRGGQGERRTFRILLKWLANEESDLVRKNLANVAFYGRFDDLLCLLDTELNGDVCHLIKNQLEKDIDSERPSLLAKWLPSENASSTATRVSARRLINIFGTTPRAYRKLLSELRSRIDVVERKMCAQEWEYINFENVPSKAATNYRDAFKKHEAQRYAEYLSAVESGNADIKAKTLYPYEIIRQVELKGYAEDKTLDLQWKALPDYLAGNPHNGIVVADVSGSMYGLPMQISISLAIYFAERNRGEFRNRFITFSMTPELQTVKGKNISEKAENLSRAEWNGNTNLQVVFDLILNTAVRHEVPQKDMPNAIYVVSDMEFDTACSNNSNTNLEVIQTKYQLAGYKMPRLIFWNVNARNAQFPIVMKDKNVQLVSGASPAILKTLLEGKNLSAYDLMMSVVNSPRYSKIYTK